ncbi:hypothetical protein [Mycobacterium sp.]|uniref:hypothetical protein n=1 Tax=Mycobacterium sp. TaxID=1785 RepID=UPI003F965A5D
MGRKIAVPWHVVFFLVAGALYFYFVLPRWLELMGDTSQTLGTALRIVTGALIGLAALPVVFTLLRTRKPELGTPQLALSLRTWSIVAHVLAGVLIIGTAISEIWLSLDAAGQYLFAVYGGAAAIALLGLFAFYLSFVAELPPPPPKPIKAKKPKQRRIGRRKKRDEADLESQEETPEATGEPEDAEETEEAAVGEPDETETLEPAEETLEEGAAAVAPTAEPESPDSAAADDSEDSEGTEDTEEPRGGLRNRRPTGKASHRLRRRSTRGAVTLDEPRTE